MGVILDEWQEGGSSYRIRLAEETDAAELLAIYAPYITDTAITYEYEVPSVEEFRERMLQTMEKYPYLVAERESEILGYAYTSRFHPRAAYGWCAETSIYLRMGSTHQGLGKRLYQVLERCSLAQGILNLNACISYPEEEDDHLTLNSVQFHEQMGYRMVGIFHQCGYKFGKWYGMCWMEKMLGEHLPEPREVIPFHETRMEIIR